MTNRLFVASFCFVLLISISDETWIHAERNTTITGQFQLSLDLLIVLFDGSQIEETVTEQNGDSFRESQIVIVDAAHSASCS